MYNINRETSWFFKGAEGGKMNTFVIVTVIFFIGGWYATGIFFKDKEDRRWRWVFRVAIVGVYCIAIGYAIKQEWIYEIGLIILALVIGTGFIKD